LTRYRQNLAALGHGALDEILGHVPDQAALAFFGRAIPIQVAEQEQVGEEPVPLLVALGIFRIAGIAEDEHLSRLGVLEARQLAAGKRDGRAVDELETQQEVPDLKGILHRGRGYL